MLWDYRINCGASDSSAYFIFSNPSEQMTQAIKSLLPECVDSAQSILKEMVIEFGEDFGEDYFANKLAGAPGAEIAAMEAAFQVAYHQVLARVRDHYNKKDREKDKSYSSGGKFHGDDPFDSPVRTHPYSKRP